MLKNKKLKGFTLIELLVVIAIMGLLATFAVIALDNARQKARDARRLSDMTQIQKALELYFDKYSNYPPAISGDGSWEDSTEDDGDFIDYLKDYGYMGKVPIDPINNSTYRYSYHRYDPGGGVGCDLTKGYFYVIGARNMETSGNPYPTSPGWECGTRNWQAEFEWVTGKYQKE